MLAHFAGLGRGAGVSFGGAAASRVVAGLSSLVSMASAVIGGSAGCSVCLVGAGQSSLVSMVLGVASA